MAINFSINDKIRINDSYIANYLRYLPSSPTLQQTLQSLGYLGPGLLQVLASGNYLPYSFIRLLPLTPQNLPDFNSPACNRGNGLTLFFDSDEQINACFNQSAGMQSNDFQVFTAVNTGAVTIPGGYAVYQTGIDAETSYPTVDKAHADSIASSSYCGLAETDILVGAIGTIRTGGCFQGINTLGGALGGPMFLSTEPGLLQTVPSRFIVQVGVITGIGSKGTIRLGPIFASGALPIRGIFG